MKEFRDWYPDRFPQLAKEFALRNTEAYAQYAIVEGNGEGDLEYFANEVMPQEFMEFVEQKFEEYLEDKVDEVRAAQNAREV